MFASLARQGFALLDAQERAGFWRLLVLMVVIALFDTVGVASILPFLAILAEPQAIHASPLLQSVYEGLGYTDEFRFLTALGLAVFVVIITGQLLKAWGSYEMVKFGKMREVSLGTRLLASYLARPYVFFTEKNSAQLSKEILSEVSLVSDGMFLPTLKVLSTAIVFLCLTALLFWVDPFATMLAALFVGGCYGGIFTLSHKALERIGTARYGANERRFRAVQEAMGSIKELKLHAKERVYIGKFAGAAATFARVQALAIAIAELPRFLLEAIVFGGMMAFLLLLLQAEGGDIRSILPTIGVFGLAGAKMFPAVQTLYANLSMVNVNAPALKEILDQLGTDEAAIALAKGRSDGQAAVPIPAPARQIELARVAFTYPQARRPAFVDLDLVIPVNTTVGIVGSTGAGKTTAVDVLLGLLAPDAGQLRVDGRPITDATLQGWQQHVGYVPQQLYILDDSVSANIAFGVPEDEIDLARVRRAAELAGIDAFITDDLPQGYDTRLGDRGSKLSGGQRQRIGIARALYKDPAVLVFDEATSSLDNLSERAVIDAIHRLRSHKTIVMVAHRLSTVRHCDQIIVIDGGAVHERGTYDELVRRGGKFTSLANAVA